MTRRQRSQLVAILVALFPMTGCLGPLSSRSFSLPAISSGTPSAPQDLSPAKSADACFTLAETLEQNSHLTGAVVEFEKARQFNPRKPGISAHLAVLYDKLGNQPKALVEYQQAISESPKDAELLNNFGYYYYSHGNWSDAEAELRKAVAVDPAHKRAWINLGMTLAQEKHYPESLNAFKKAVTEAEAYSNLAFIMTTQGKRDEAREAYSKALQISPDLQIARLAMEKLDHPGKKAEAKIPVSTKSATRTEAPAGPTDDKPIIVP